MPTSDALPPAPAGVTRALAQLSGIAALLECADPDRWDSLGRPEAPALAALVRGAEGELRAELGELVTLPG